MQETDQIMQEKCSIAEELSFDKVRFENLSDLYKMFSDTTRIRILVVLMKKELCVSDIALKLGMTISSISHQLRILKQSKLIKYRRSGKSVLYSLADEHVYLILSMGIEHLMEDSNDER